MAEVKRNLDSIVAHMPGVRDAVADELESRADRVRAVVEAHRHTGALASGMTVRTNRTDSTVTLEDPAVVAINYGHLAPNGCWVAGIHAIEAGL
ncbi:DUF5403 family protein [Streptomyces halobius]|uniref:DUF5403 family protein n=1 Tax=Streptomyces halobius TaxID=2879846 RepID=A0ABY4MB62_9ACTN|nr:DUF5403 family protein [Streptomyces halobius]UQA94928.1 DUF5403 family protein [Streptomyces halobius]